MRRSCSPRLVAAVGVVAHRGPARHDADRDGLAEQRVQQRERDALGDGGGVGEHDLLNLERRDNLAATVDDLHRAVREVEPLVAVEPPEVARAKPAAAAAPKQSRQRRRDITRLVSEMRCTRARNSRTGAREPVDADAPRGVYTAASSQGGHRGPRAKNL